MPIYRTSMYSAWLIAMIIVLVCKFCNSGAFFKIIEKMYLILPAILDLRRFALRGFRLCPTMF